MQVRLLLIIMLSEKDQTKQRLPTIFFLLFLFTYLSLFFLVVVVRANTRTASLESVPV